MFRSFFSLQKNPFDYLSHETAEMNVNATSSKKQDLVYLNNGMTLRTILESETKFYAVTINFRALPNDKNVISSLLKNISSEIRLRIMGLTTAILNKKLTLLIKALENQSHVKISQVDLKHNLTLHGTRRFSRPLFILAQSLIKLDIQLVNDTAPKIFFENFIKVQTQFKKLTEVSMTFRKAFPEIVLFVANLAANQTNDKRKWPVTLLLVNKSKKINVPKTLPLNIERVKLSRAQEEMICKIFFEDGVRVDTKSCVPLIQLVLRTYKTYKILFTKVYHYGDTDILWTKKLMKTKFSLFLRAQALNRNAIFLARLKKEETERLEAERKKRNRLRRWENCNNCGRCRMCCS